MKYRKQGTSFSQHRPETRYCEPIHRKKRDVWIARQDQGRPENGHFFKLPGIQDAARMAV